ncbi:hypothetical protein HanIR_Chr17g0881691 [Helianthus annuus]|nr:hypothetical protein HanIR_Chr17g0881691 [Helianthus annuus]
MVTPLEKEIERYIYGLPDSIQDIVTDVNPTTVRHAIVLSATLTELQVRKGVNLPVRGTRRNRLILRRTRIRVRVRKVRRQRSRGSGRMLRILLLQHRLLRTRRTHQLSLLQRKHMLVPHLIVHAATVIMLHSKLASNAQRVENLGIWPIFVVWDKIRFVTFKLRFKGMLRDSHRVHVSTVESLVTSVTTVQDR